MTGQEIIALLGKKGADKEKITELVKTHPAVVKDLVAVIETEKGAIKFGCDKVIQQLSASDPELILPYFNFFFGNAGQR